ncbi:amino acid ABC transporter membrane protein 2, PAAT family [Nitrobacter winogradskyi Nb-255]|uniref:Amino acid ABC transporter membrane protein 2, PAAT family n=1 Tax=Nitrobacter winogradskyi (strain ATCC 25391 / DSM 10237 / CIP 104748 / NCIMB 11846 / Nb-255) TaxID=323098 RepID=Q3SSF3_NITWN|nr:amino acid ABC transporter permease [Nitrobacter winogradskyi]ABA04788.1 amino acid ABC transporter membrane protein 2, PAAT family [Nitrobacter winogradskyi Nb-255]
MTARPAPSFVRDDLVPERRAPVTTTNLLRFVQIRLFNSPGNALLTFVGVALLWLFVVPAVRFLFIDAAWEGQDRTSCLAADAGQSIGACWPFVQAKITQFIYGFYPEPERWRVNLTFLLAAVLLLPLLIPRLPAKRLNAGLFFVAFPVTAFFLLHGGGITGFGVSWSAGLLSSLADSVGDAGRQLAASGEAGEFGTILRPVGGAIASIGDVVNVLASPLMSLRDRLQGSGQPVWYDFGLTAAFISLLLFFFSGGFRAGWGALLTSLTAFAGMGLIIAVMPLDRGGLPVVDTRLWGGLLVTLVVSVTGIVSSIPIGIALALGRRSTLPLIRVFSIAFIEFWRGVPLITVLFFATYMLPLFLPGNFTVDGLVRVLIGIALFAGAYNAEVIRGGLAAVPGGQAEAAHALGLSYWKTTGLIVMPQAVRHVIPGLVNSFIALFKDTSLVSIVALFDLLGILRASFADPTWATPTTLFTGFAFTGLIYFAFCFSISRYSLFVEHRLNAHRRT